MKIKKRKRIAKTSFSHSSNENKKRKGIVRASTGNKKRKQWDF